MKKRILSLFLALVMLFSCLSLNVFATEAQSEELVSVTNSVISNTLDAHTDDEIKAAINTVKSQSTVLTNFGTSSIIPSHGVATVDGNATLVAKDGKIVRQGVNNAKGYLQLDSVFTGRTNILRNLTANKNLLGQDFVVQFDVTFTEEFFRVLGTSSAKNILQFANYAGINGYEGSIYRPNAIMVNLVNVTNGCLTLKDTTETLYSLAADTNYTIAVHVRPQDIDSAAGVYGTVDLYVNGELVAEKSPLCNAEENALMTMPEDRPYFADDNISGGQPTEGSTAYFFSDTLPENLEEIYAACGFTNTPANAQAIGTVKGVQDYALGFIRFFQYINGAFTADAYYADNFLVYYAEEYNSTLVDHKIKNAHAHDFAKTTTSVTYTCEFCDGVKKTVETLDANGDRVCDICLGELPTGGTLSRAELIQNGAIVMAANDLNGGSFSPYTLGDDGAAVIKLSETNDKYAYWAPGTKVVESENKPMTAYLQYQHLGDTRIDTVKRYDSLAGNSYIVSADIKVNKDNAATIDSLIQVLCYMSSSNDCTTIATAVFFKPVKLDASGELVYRNGGKNVSTGIFLNDDEWHTISVHHTPRAEKENTYDLYLDGKCIFADIQAMSDADNAAMTWSTTQLNANYPTSTFTSNGAKDFIPALIRFGQHTPAVKSGATENVSICMDNIKCYYADSYLECAHDYAMSHTHDIKNGMNDVVYACSNCGYTETVEIAMALNDYKSMSGTGVIPAISEISGLTTDAYYATEFSSNYANAIKNGKGALVGGDDAANTIKYIDGAYIQYQKATTANGAYLQYWFDNAQYTSRFTYGYNNFEELKGDSYTVTLDLKIDSLAAFSADFYLVQVLDYLAFPGGAYSADLSNFSPVWFKPLKLQKSGNLVCIANSDVSHKTIPLNENQWYTITMHHTPSGDAISPANSFDIFINGECVVENATAIGSGDSKNLAWETNAVKSEGAKDFIPTAIRLAQTAPSGNAFSLDNLFIYKNQDVIDCAHKFTDCNACDWCGYEVAVKENYCEICDGTAISDEVAITGRSATLGELVDMNFYAAINSAFANKEDAEATVTCGDTTVTVALKDAEKTETGYKFSIPLTSVQMASDVTIEIDGEAYTTSIADYAIDLIATDAKAAPVAKALLNYGAAAQEYFAEKNNNAALAAVLANAGLTEADKAVKAMSEEDVAKYTFKQNGATEAVRFVGARLIMSSETHMKLYFTAPEGATVTVGGETVIPTMEGGEYYVYISAKTPAAAMTDAVKVTVSYDNITLDATVNIFSAVAAGISNSSNAKLVSLFNAYAEYCNAAEAYVAN